MPLFFFSYKRNLPEIILYSVILFIIVTNIYASCGPLTVNYVQVENREFNNETVVPGKEGVRVDYEVKLHHLPDQMVSTILNFIVVNESPDTVVLTSVQAIHFESKKNVLDTSQANAFFAKADKAAIAPHDKLELSTDYWSKTFKGSYRELLKKIQDDEIVINITYLKKGKSPVIRRIIARPEVK